MKISGEKQSYTWNEGDAFYDKAKFGSTFPGICVEDKRKVVIKRFLADHSNSEIEIHRIKREAELHHRFPEILGPAELIESRDNIYLVKNFIEGKDFKSLSADRSFSRKANTDFWIRCVMNLCDAFHQLHQQGIYHCDIKPSNLIFSGSTAQDIKTEPKCSFIDLGSAYEKGKNFKVPFSFIYSPPELLLGLNECIGPWTDIYALAVVLYEKMAGQAHIFHQNAGILIQMQLTQDLKKTSSISPELFDILLKATQKGNIAKPPSMYKRHEIAEIVQQGISARHQSMLEFKNDLENILHLPPVGILDKMKRLF